MQSELQLARVEREVQVDNELLLLLDHLARFDEFPAPDAIRLND